jgi:xanthine dehydrogenase YagT iron-sulfur-binding subunit
VEGRLSRRGFLRQTTLAGVTTALIGSGAARAETSRSGRGAGPSGSESLVISLNVNGTTRELQVEPRTTLADALRDFLALRGTKIGCDRGACSACTVWLDGAPVCSCMLLAVDAADRSVTTVEGLTGEQSLNPVQAAFIEYDAVQCGYCTPGLVMSCAALLRDQPGATAEDVRRAISGHVCRCGTYPHVVAATLAAARDRQR